MIGELSLARPVFARLWAAQRVKEKMHGGKRIRQPLAGELTMTYESLALPGEPNQLLVTYLAGDGETRERLRLLASWVSPAAPQPMAAP
jgi:transcription regulator MmyB-like protein